MGVRKQQLPGLAKLSQPRLHNAVKRERLFALLDGRRQQPIIWVGGPAGAGKTALVASYLKARKAITLWYQVDEGDRDPATFFHYLSKLAQQDGKKRSLPQLSSEDVGAFARHYFREFFQHIGANTVLVLDNCQNAAGEAFHLILRVACEELPQQSNIIALSRSVFPRELARLAVRRRSRHSICLTEPCAAKRANSRGSTLRLSAMMLLCCGHSSHATRKMR